MVFSTERDSGIRQGWECGGRGREEGDYWLEKPSLLCRNWNHTIAAGQCEHPSKWNKVQKPPCPQNKYWKCQRNDKRMTCAQQTVRSPPLSSSHLPAYITREGTSALAILPPAEEMGRDLKQNTRNGCFPPPTRTTTAPPSEAVSPQALGTHLQRP